MSTTSQSRNSADVTHSYFSFPSTTSRGQDTHFLCFLPKMMTKTRYVVLAVAILVRLELKSFSTLVLIFSPVFSQ